jgi:transcriptional regulator with XRE-family HTH domain
VLAGFTRAEVSTRLSVKIQTVSAWERGDRVPATPHVNQLAALYGMDDGAIAMAIRLSAVPRPKLRAA